MSKHRNLFDMFEDPERNYGIEIKHEFDWADLIAFDASRNVAIIKLNGTTKTVGWYGFDNTDLFRAKGGKDD